MECVVAETRICLFDIMGTVVDLDGSLGRDLSAVLQRSAPEPSEVAIVVAAAERRLGELMADVTSGQRTWAGHRELRRMALSQTVAAHGWPALDPVTEAEASGVIHRLTPWPDAAAALRSLQEVVTVVGLSNADLAELVGLSRQGGLWWHGLLSGAFVHAFKPDPAVYRMALEVLDARPDEVMMVAAHPWDLRAAAEHGFATAYVARPDAEPPAADDDFDLVVDDLAALATLLHHPSTTGESS